MLAQALVLSALCAAAAPPEEDALAESEPGQLDQSGLERQALDPVPPTQDTPPPGIAGPNTAANESYDQMMGSRDSLLKTDLPEPKMLPPVEPGTAGSLWKDPTRAMVEASGAPDSGARSFAQQQQPAAGQPTSRLEENRLGPLGELLRPSMPEELLPATRIMLAVSAGLGASLAGLGALATLGGNVLYAQVTAGGYAARQRSQASVGGTLLLVLAGVLFTGALACLMVGVTAATVGKAAEMMTPPEQPKK